MVKDEFCDHCRYSYQELEAFRTPKGFLDLDRAGVRLHPQSKEKMGNQNRIKNWVKFGEDLALIKGEIILDKERNYGVYAELIVEEMGKYLGIPMAHYDLVQLTDDTGDGHFGVLSLSMIDPQSQHLLTLRQLIGDDESIDSAFMDATNYDDTITQLKAYFKKMGLSFDRIQTLITNYQKRLAFTLLVSETDKHIENISFIQEGQNIELSPNYDSEASLLLDNDQTTVHLLLEDYQSLKEAVSIAQPRIGKMVSEDVGGFSSVWMDTLEALIEEDDVYDYCNHVLRQKIDMDEIFHRLEDRLQASLPEEVKLLAKYAYYVRYQAFFQIVDGLAG